MSETQHYPNGIEFRPLRPRGTLAGALIGGLLGLAITKDAGGALAAGAIGGALSNQPLSLNVAVRQFFAEKGLQIAGFYRPNPYTVRVAFGFEGRGWLIESRAPQNVPWTIEQLEDWLYGDLTGVQLPAKLNKIQAQVQLG